MAASGPYIARLRTFEATGRDPYLVTDYVPSVSLKDALDKCGPLPSETVRLLASALCTALIRSHQRKVVHRDLSPPTFCWPSTVHASSTSASPV